ncbi:hypothetical protein ACO0LF_31995, partial [Undibacterium sp. Di27W]|uniref:hypothetical protein n=1 Tax=Undibacterium sp. Di27W TaxID=3413036 RepID=UPI003BEFBB1C
MSASLALKQVQTTSTSTNLAKLEAQANYAATQLAAAGVALEAVAAALAYLKAQASTALADYTQVDNQLTAAKESLKTATASKAAA